ncbi:Hypothetical predicted protein [Cloeon dipterum]|uniref:Bee-milk protein n=1 Tax=Cloeon dipterum TaxID=197152 RepID=A0A8S1DBJ8_9INSE|nr:Hypothetical predicted protein [Cloeon dipterum]
MRPCFFVIVLLHLSLATAVNFTQVLEWPDGMAYEWPSEAKKTQALKDGTFKPEKIEPIFMAVYGTRIFLSLVKYSNIPVTLVSLPTSSKSLESPKLTPFPSWDMHGIGDCNKIEVATGLEVDSIGRLWVLDSGSENCNAKLWTIDLSNNDHTELVHQFSFYDWMHDFVLDETPNGTLAFISNYGAEHIVVFSLESNQSWIVETPGLKSYSIALSPKEEPRQLYVGNLNTYVPFTFALDLSGTFWMTELNKSATKPRLRLLNAAVGAKPYNFENSTVKPTSPTTTTIFPKTYPTPVSLSNPTTTTTKPESTSVTATASSQIHKTTEIVANSNAFSTQLPEINHTTPVSMSIPSTTKSSMPTEENATSGVKESSILNKNSNESWIIIITLICTNLLLSLIILWLVVGQRRTNLTPQNTNEAQQISVIFENNEDVAAVEMQCDANGSQSRPFRLRRVCSFCDLAVQFVLVFTQQIRNVLVMNPSFFVIVLLHLSLTCAVHFTQVSEWPDGIDYDWPDKANWRLASFAGYFTHDKIKPIFMAVYGTRIFLTLDKLIRSYILIPETLVTLPTNCACSGSLYLVPFPSREMQGLSHCHLIEQALGLQVDSVGRLWVLDNGSKNCSARTAKLWTVDLSNNDHTELVHQFSFYDWMHDFVLDETPNVWKKINLGFYTSALGTTISCFQFPLPHFVAELNCRGIMYTAFWKKNYIHSWNTSQPFEEQPFYEVGNLTTKVPFTFALDSSGIFWMTELNKTATKPRLRLLKAAVGAKPHNIEDPTSATPETTPLLASTAANLTQVFEWPDGMDYEWPFEADRTKALEIESVNLENLYPLYMAVYKTRIFLSLEKVDGIPVTLVSLPTSSAYFASPKLTPFPSWDMHGVGDCKKIQEARGLEVDSVGRLWVLDSGSRSCNTKLWFIHLSELDRTERIHVFQYLRYTHMNDLVLDETPNGSLAYISSRGERHIVVFSLERRESWRKRDSSTSANGTTMHCFQFPLTHFAKEFELHIRN